MARVVKYIGLTCGMEEAEGRCDWCLWWCLVVRGVEGVDVEACEVVLVEGVGRVSGKGRLNVFSLFVGGLVMEDGSLLSLVLSGDGPMLGDVLLFGETCNDDVSSGLVPGCDARERLGVAVLLGCGQSDDLKPFVGIFFFFVTAGAGLGVASRSKSSPTGPLADSVKISGTLAPPSTISASSPMCLLATLRS